MLPPVLQTQERLGVLVSQFGLRVVGGGRSGAARHAAVNKRCTYCQTCGASLIDAISVFGQVKPPQLLLLLPRLKRWQ